MNDIAAAVFPDRVAQTKGARSAAKDKHEMQTLAVTLRSQDIECLKPAMGGEELFHVYTFSNGMPGYVIVSTDDRLPGVLAFSDTEHFDTESLPGTMAGLLTGYAAALESLAGEGTADGTPLPEGQTDSVKPLLGDIAFSQRAPYNDRCPLYEGQKTLVGCIATAMSQMMAYHRYPIKMSGEPVSYTTESLQILVEWDCSTTTFDWENTLDTYVQEVPEYTANESVTDTDYMLFTDMKSSSSYNNYVELYTFTNVSGKALSFTAQLLLTDAEGRFIRPVGKEEHVDEIMYRAYYKTYYLKHTLPSDLPDGDYRLYVAVRLDDTAEWSLVKKATTANSIQTATRVEAYIPVTKRGLSYTLFGDSSTSYACGYNASQAEAIATLSAACGASALMDYTAGGSAASVLDARDALIEHMGYEEDIAYLNASYFTRDGWIEFIKNELKEGRPVYCDGHSETGQGHAFILDGYKYLGDTPYFHINWGWNGSSNGYFLIDYLQPSEAGDGGYETNYGYSLNILSGIAPDNGKDDGFTFGATGISAALSSTDGNTVQIEVKKLQNCSHSDFNGEILAYAVNGESEYPLGIFYSVSRLNPGWYYERLPKTMTLPAELPDGDYTLQLRAHADNSTVETVILSPEYPTFTYGEGSSNGITSPTTPTADTEPVIYDMAGKRVNAPLHRGVYIISGKKVYVP